jgi:hypothetical protein
MTDEEWTQAGRGTFRWCANPVERGSKSSSGTRLNQLVLAVADAEHSGSASSHQVPHGITHQLAVLHFHSQALLALQKQVRLGLGPRHVTALHDHGIFGHAHLSELWLALRRVL